MHSALALIYIMNEEQRLVLVTIYIIFNIHLLRNEWYNSNGDLFYITSPHRDHTSAIQFFVRYSRFVSIMGGNLSGKKPNTTCSCKLCHLMILSSHK